MSRTIDTIRLFRDRLGQLVDRHGGTIAALAREAGVDRSTLAQLLDERNQRLPRAETLISLAGSARVSVDWLLGLTEGAEIGPEIIDAAMQMERTVHAPIDDRFLGWMQEATGARIKTVPSTLPDFLKSEDVLRFEYGEAAGLGADRWVEVARSRLDYCRQPDTELEIAFPLQQLDLFVAGAGLWRGLDVAARRRGLDLMVGLCDELYPRVRVYLFDQRRTLSVPFTVFGTRRVSVYLGERYLLLNALSHVRLFAQRFDELIRMASVLPHAVTGRLAEARAALGAG